MRRIDRARRAAFVALFTVFALSGCMQSVLRWSHDPSRVEPVIAHDPSAGGTSLALLRIEGVDGLDDGFYGVTPAVDADGETLALTHVWELDETPPVPRAATVAFTGDRFDEPPTASLADPAERHSLVAFERFRRGALDGPFWMNGVAYEGSRHVVRAYAPSDDGSAWVELGELQLRGREMPRWRRWTGNALAVPAGLLDVVGVIVRVPFALLGGGF